MTTVAARRQQTLMGMLVCPACRGELRRVNVRRAHDLVWDAALECDSCNGLSGVVIDGKPSFLPRDFADLRQHGSGYRVDAWSKVTRTGEWDERAAGLMSAGAPGDGLHVETALSAIRISFLTHDWSGQAEVLVDGVVEREVDLFSAQPGDLHVELRFPDLRLRRVDVRPTGRRSSLSADAQVVVKSVEVWVGEEDFAQPTFEPVDRGNPYPPRFASLLEAVPEDGIVFDIGGGDRQYGDPRVFNLEYLPYRAPDLYADGHRLPLRDGVCDLILSQAVLEHVPEPQLAVDELRRVLSPSGTVYAEIAFMQPLHAVPSHYFNVTPYGAEHLFRDWASVQVDWFGGVADTVAWWGRLAGLPSRWPAERLALLDQLLNEFDADLSYDDLRSFASAVAVLAKP